jgi:alcohol dehydrogenase
MRALLFDTQLRLDTEYPEPTLQMGEALIRPHLVGICNTDIEITRGYMGFQGVLGHEFVGTIVACDDHAWLGQRVVGEINAACGQCAVCARGATSHCPHRTTLGIDRRDGAMAELLSLPVSCLHAVPDSVPDQAAVFTEPLAAALQILEQAHLRPTERVAVIGDGKLGLLIAQVLRLPGCDVTLVGHHPERWPIVQTLGIHASTTEGLESGSFDVAVDCTGQASGLMTARQLLHPRGRLILKSTFAGDSPLNLSMIVVDEITIVGSRCGPFAPALRLLEHGLVQTEPLISGCFPLAEGLRAFEASRGQLKILLEVPDVS